MRLRRGRCLTHQDLNNVPTILNAPSQNTDKKNDQPATFAPINFLKMKKTISATAILITLFLFASAFNNSFYRPTSQTSILNNQDRKLSTFADTIHFPGEKHFANVQQLTFGGDNAEAYFSFDGQWIIFQRTNPKEGIMCDEMFIGKVPTNGEKFTYKRVSSGKGRTTCGAFLKDGKHIIYASTHLGADTCPPVPDRKKYGNKYIWPLYSSFDIFMADLDGNIVNPTCSPTI